MSQAALQHLQNSHVNHPAFLRADGRPVVFFWRPNLYGVETWRNIRAAVDPNFSQIWIGEGLDTSYLAVFDGHHLYSNTWNPAADLNATNQKFAERVAAARDSYGAYKFWVATVMPGYNDVKVRGGGGFARDREGGNYFSQSWQAAIASRPNWIVINSFNEWPEGSYIEPSAAFGDLFIGLAANYSAQFKSGGGATIAAAALPAPLPPPPTPTPTPPPTVPTAYVNTALLNLRGGPSTNDVIVDQVPSGGALQITGRHASFPDWWQVTTEKGVAWVYGPLVTTGGPMEQVAQLADDAVPTDFAAESAPATETAQGLLSAGENPGENASTGVPSAIAAQTTPVDRAVPSPLLDPNFDSLLPALAR